MTVSYWQDASPEHVIECDVCVVGAGIVGLYLARLTQGLFPGASADVLRSVSATRLHRIPVRTAAGPASEASMPSAARPSRSASTCFLIPPSIGPVRSMTRMMRDA